MLVPELTCRLCRDRERERGAVVDDIDGDLLVVVAREPATGVLLPLPLSGTVVCCDVRVGSASYEWGWGRASLVSVRGRIAPGRGAGPGSNPAGPCAGLFDTSEVIFDPRDLRFEASFAVARSAFRAEDGITDGEETSVFCLPEGELLCGELRREGRRGGSWGKGKVRV